MEVSNGVNGDWRVVPFVHDAELEGVLNELDPEYHIVSLFRNSPGEDGQETTTVVASRKSSVAGDYLLN